MLRIVPIVLASLLLLSCNAASDADAQRDWAHVLSHKKAAASPNASTHAKQIYADTLGAFVRKHPGHGRARVVYQTIQLDFAHELSSMGRYRDAIRFYRAVLANDPSNLEAAQGLTVAVDRLAVSRQRLLGLEKGMTQKQVAAILGKPIPGWRVKKERPEADIESWYYMTTEGGIAGVYFRDGLLFAAEARSHEKLAPLGQ